MPSAFGDAVGIEDHDHRPVSKNGIAAEHRDVTQDRRDRFDDDFLGVENAIDDNPKQTGADLCDDDVRTRSRLGSRIPPSGREQIRQRETSGSNLWRRKHETGVSLISSITLSPVVRSWRARAPVRRPTSAESRTVRRGSTISAETIASVSGILDDEVVLRPELTSPRQCRRSFRCWF